MYVNNYSLQFLTGYLRCNVKNTFFTVKNPTLDFLNHASVLHCVTISSTPYTSLFINTIHMLNTIYLHKQFIQLYIILLYCYILLCAQWVSGRVVRTFYNSIDSRDRQAQHTEGSSQHWPGQLTCHGHLWKTYSKQLKYVLNI